MTVEQLFERWRQGRDPRALAAVFDRTAPEVWRVARHLCGDRSEADDLLQATFLAAMEGASRWRRGEPLVPWLLGIMSNKLRMARRRERRALPAEAVRTGASEDPVNAAEHRELHELLQQRLGELPEVYRAVLVLQLEHGLSAAEVAHALGRPRATVRSQLHRGLELLRRALPAGLLAVPASAERPDLRAVRAAVLGSAVKVAAGAAGIGAGASIMWKKLAVVPLVLLCGAGIWAWTAPGAAGEPSPVAEPRSVTAAALPSAAPVGGATSPERQELATPVEPAAAPALLRVRVTWSDGAPAAVQVAVRPVPPGGWFAQRFADADGRGIAEFAGLAPGRIHVRTRHGGSVEAEVPGGGTTEVELRIPEGIDARGRVLAPDGQPVANAILVIGPGSEDMLEVARSDANGAFYLRALQRNTLVAAFADGFGTSEARSAGEFAEGPQDLKLTGTGGCVAGRVYGSNGRPLAGAWVAHGNATGELLSTGGRRGMLAMRAALTDAAGGFRLQGVPIGQTWPLHAGAAGHAAWKGHVRVPGAGEAIVEIRLEAAVQLSGVVRNGKGEPVRATVLVVDRNSPGKRIGDNRPSWSRAFALTKPDGAYAFANLPAGDLLVQASDQQGNVACCQLAARPGDRLVQDLVLGSELAIRGRLLDDAGSPLCGWRVTAEAVEGVPEPNSVETAADGTFKLSGCAQARYTVRCYASGNWHQAILERRGVEPGGDVLALRAPRAAMPSAHVSGRLAADEPLGELHAVLVGERSGLQLSETLRPGAEFKLGPVPAGRYALQLQGSLSGGFGLSALAELGTFDLEQGQRRDLGEVRMPEQGELAFTMVDPLGRPVAKAWLLLGLVGAPMGGVGVQVADGRGSCRLSPGTYLPSFCSGGLHVEHEPIAITSGRRTEVRFQVARAVLRHGRWDLSEIGVPLQAFASWKKDGRTLQRSCFGFWQEGVTRMEHQFTPGAWELELQIGFGPVQRFPFVVTADEIGPDLEFKVTR